jgi:hypothetical protein
MGARPPVSAVFISIWDDRFELSSSLIAALLSLLAAAQRVPSTRPSLKCWVIPAFSGGGTRAAARGRQLHGSRIRTA